MHCAEDTRRSCFSRALKLPPVLMQQLPALRPLSGRSPIPYAGRGSPPSPAARPGTACEQCRLCQPAERALPQRHAHPHFSFFLLLLLGVQGDENEWEKNAYVFMISQSSAVSRSETVSAHDGHPGAWRGDGICTGKSTPCLASHIFVSDPWVVA